MFQGALSAEILSHFHFNPDLEPYPSTLRPQGMVKMKKYFILCLETWFSSHLAQYTRNSTIEIHGKRAQIKKLNVQ